jgi:hypothetical protein
MLWWPETEILFDPLNRSSPFIGGRNCQPIQIEHRLHIRGSGGGRGGLDTLLMSMGATNVLDGGRWEWSSKLQCYAGRYNLVYWRQVVTLFKNFIYYLESYSQYWGAALSWWAFGPALPPIIWLFKCKIQKQIHNFLCASDSIPQI